MNTLTYEDFEDTTYNFTFSGTWDRSTVRAKAGTGSYKAGTITHNQSTSATFSVVIAAGTNNPALVLWYNLESESTFDFFTVLVDGVSQFSNSGTVTTWTQVVVPLTVGTQAIELRYSKDGSVSVGLDTVFVDEMSIVSSGTVVLPLDPITMDVVWTWGLPPSVAGWDVSWD